MNEKLIERKIIDDIVRFYDQDKKITLINLSKSNYGFKHDRIDSVIKIKNEMNIDNNLFFGCCLFFEKQKKLYQEQIMNKAYCFCLKTNIETEIDYSLLNNWRITEFICYDVKIIKGINVFFDKTLIQDISDEKKNSDNFRQFCSYLPKKPSIDLVENQDLWKEEFTEYIRIFLSGLYDEINIPIEDKNEEIKILTQPENMNIWQRSVTHKSYDMNNNYEELELLGDANCARSFKNQIAEKFGIDNVTPKELSELKAQYMSEIHQGKFSKLMNLRNWCIKDPLYEHGDKLDEDLFESFVGALDFLASLIVPGRGSVLCDIFIKIIMRSLNLNKSVSFGIDKTALLQRIEKMYIKKPVVKEKYCDDGRHLTLKFDDEKQYGDLRKLFPKLPEDGIIADINADNSIDEDKELYESALSYIENECGITHTEAMRFRDQKLKDLLANNYNKMMKFVKEKQCDTFEIIIFKPSVDMDKINKLKKKMVKKCVKIFAVKLSVDNGKDKFFPLSPMYSFGYDEQTGKTPNERDCKLLAIKNFLK